MDEIMFGGRLEAFRGIFRKHYFENIYKKTKYFVAIFMRLCYN